MAKNFRRVREKMAPERQERIRKRTQELLAELPLQELRQARALSQEELAEVLGLNQATISKLERRTDMYLSSLRRFVEAMGGELEVTAKFPEGKVRIQLFEELEEDELHLPKTGPALLNVGSVGQPRDGDPRAAYGLLDLQKNTLRLRRVPYDIKGAQTDILKAGLPAWLAQRLDKGQ